MNFCSSKRCAELAHVSSLAAVAVSSLTKRIRVYVSLSEEDG